VSVNFDDNNDSYQITRHIAPKSDLKIIKNEIDISGKGIRESEKKLGEVLPDITKDLIASTIIIGQGMPNKFSSFSPSGRKDLLEKLTKSDFMVDDIRQRVNTRLTELQRQLRDCEDSLLIHKTQNKTIEATLRVKLDEISVAVKPDFISQINELKTQIETIQKDIDAKITQVKFYEEVEDNTNKKLVQILECNTAESNEEKEAYELAFRNSFTEKTRLETEIKSLKKTISDLKAIKDTCPTCGQKLPGAIKPDTSTQEKELEVLNSELAVINSKLSEYNTKHAEYQAHIKSKYEASISELKKQVAEAKHEKEVAQRDLTDFTHYQNTTREQLSKLNYEKDN
jgi:DNA repair exonuclease SbcCD ATPase subunit